MKIDQNKKKNNNKDDNYTHTQTGTISVFQKKQTSKHTLNNQNQQNNL